ncbi:hypothetical protein N9937_00045 [bacterium]|nr:hypothetical protein [bacterium]
MPVSNMFYLEVTMNHFSEHKALTFKIMDDHGLDIDAAMEISALTLALKHSVEV